ncbi:MAG: DUF4230 domain-containing protein [Flavobacteriaceae bacterium]|nr:DUF4230 domain-containing protein [Flavobacteriaceae bacterium]
MEGVFIGLIVGIILSFFAYQKFGKSFTSKARREHQSIVLMEKIKKVCKLISVEGDFAEIYHYQSASDSFFGSLLGTKKAVVIINAKAHVGFDLTQIKLRSNTDKKTIELLAFPTPQILSIDTDLSFYDKKEGWANPIKADDLTEINQKAKAFIREKIPESGLLDEANQEAVQLLEIMHNIAQTIGWKVDYGALEQPDNQRLLKE